MRDDRSQKGLWRHRLMDGWIDVPNQIRCLHLQSGGINEGMWIIYQRCQWLRLS